MIRTARAAVLAMAMAAVVAVAGCASGSGPADAGKPATRWASSVCSSVRELSLSLKKLTARVRIREGVAQSTLNQAKAQLQGRAHALQKNALRLASAVKDVPASADGSVRTAEQQLTAVLGRSQQSIRRVSVAAAAVQRASTPSQLLTAVSAASDAAIGAAGDVGSLQDVLRRYRSSGQDSVQKTFAGAPSCAAL